MAANGISTLSTKELKQKAKLALAAIKRAATGRRSGLDITELPTQFSGNTIVNNTNVDGLQLGRPWNSLSSGLYLSNYSGYFGNGAAGVPDTPALVSTQWFANHAGNLTGTVAGDTLAYFGVSGDVISKQWVGYFKPLVSSNYQFYINSDDACYVWVGTKAISSYDHTNRDLFGRAGGTPPYNGLQTSSVIALTAGQYYPIRIQWGNRVAGGELTVSWSNTSTARTTDFTDQLFYNTAGPGF
jgi:hypothetical protein